MNGVFVNAWDYETQTIEEWRGYDGAVEFYAYGELFDTREEAERYIRGRLAEETEEEIREILGDADYDGDDLQLLRAALAVLRSRSIE